MKLTLSIPDELYESLGKSAGSAKIEAHILRTLKAFGELDLAQRPLILTPDQRRGVEEVFRTTIGSADELITKLRHLALFTIGPVERVLDSNELAVLREQAHFHGSEPEAYLRFVANEVIDRCLDRI